MALAHHRAAIDADGLAGDEIAVGRAQIDQGADDIGGHLLALERATGHGAGARGPRPFRIVGHRLAHRQARRDGVAISPEIRARIDEESRAFAQASADLESARTKLDQARELQSAFGSELTSSLSGLITGTTSVSEALDSLIRKLIEAGIQAALLGQGPLAGIMGGGSGIVGSIFGGFRAGGGEVEKGKHYVVGEKGPELFAPGRSGSVIPNEVLRSIRPPSVNVMPAQAQAAPAMTFAPTINIEGGGGTHSQNRDLSQQMMKELRGMAREVFVQEARRQRRPQGVLGN